MAADGSPEVDLETGNHPNWGERGGRVMGDLEKEIYLQAELYADEENDSAEIKRKKRMARAALTMWTESIQTTDHRILEIKSETRSIMNEVYQLFGLYSVFEGVVLTAVVTSSRLQCRHLWSPVGLSLFAYSMLVIVAFTKFQQIRALEWRKGLYYGAYAETVKQILTLRSRGYADFDFDRDCESRRRDIRRIPVWRNALGLIVPLTIFTAGLVFSLIHVLCWS